MPPGAVKGHGVLVYAPLSGKRQAILRHCDLRPRLVRGGFIQLPPCKGMPLLFRTGQGDGRAVIRRDVGKRAAAVLVQRDGIRVEFPTGIQCAVSRGFDRCGGPHLGAAVLRRVPAVEAVTRFHGRIFGELAVGAVIGHGNPPGRRSCAAVQCEVDRVAIGLPAGSQCGVGYDCDDIALPDLSAAAKPAGKGIAGARGLRQRRVYAVVGDGNTLHPTAAPAVEFYGKAPCSPLCGVAQVPVGHGFFGGGVPALEGIARALRPGRRNGCVVAAGLRRIRTIDIPGDGMHITVIEDIDRRQAVAGNVHLLKVQRGKAFVVIGRRWRFRIGFSVLHFIPADLGVLIAHNILLMLFLP